VFVQTGLQIKMDQAMDRVWEFQPELSADHSHLAINAVTNKHTVAHCRVLDQGFVQGFNNKRYIPSPPILPSLGWSQENATVFGLVDGHLSA